MENGFARVELPDGVVRPREPCTAEMFVTARGSVDESSLVYGTPGLASMTLKQFGKNWNCLVGDSQVVARDALVVGRRVHLAGVSTGKEIRLFVDGRWTGTRPIEGDLRDGAFSAMLGGLSTHWVKWGPFDGTIDEFRLSTKVRYDKSAMTTR